MEHFTDAPPEPPGRSRTPLRFRDVGVIVACLAAAAACFAGSFATGFTGLLGGTGIFLALAGNQLSKVFDWRSTGLEPIADWLNNLRLTLFETGIGFEVSVALLIWALVGPAPNGVFTWLGIVSVLVATFFLSVLAIRRMWTAQERERVRLRLARFGAFAPFVYPVGLFMQVLVLFTLTTSIFVAHGVVDFVQDDPSNATIAAFYCWHFLELVPLVQVPETLRWDPPLSYEQWQVGMLVLGFQLAGVVPVIAVIREFWRERGTRETKSML